MGSEYNIREDDGTIAIESKEIDLKITSDRKLWSRVNKGKKYVDTGRFVPKGMGRDEKTQFLIKTRRGAIARLQRFTPAQSQPSVTVEVEEMDD